MVTSRLLVTTKPRDVFVASRGFLVYKQLVTSTSKRRV